MFTVHAGAFGGVIDPLEDRFDAPLLPSADDAGGGPGGEPEPEPTSGEEGAELPAARPEGEDDEDDDADDPDLQDDGQPVDSARFKRVTAKLKKQNRRVRNLRPVAARLKDFKAQGVSFDDLVVKATNYDALNATIRGNKDLARRIYGGDDAAATPPARARAVDPADAEFDESTLPFDPSETPINRYFADLAKQNHELSRTVRQLAGRVDQVDGRDTQRVEREERGQWRGAIDGAAAHIQDEGVRTLFKDAVTAAYQGRQQHGLTPQQIVSHYLKVLKVDPTAAAKANTAAAAAIKKPAAAPVGSTQQRIAERNTTLSRNVAPQGTPVPARSGRETLADVHKRIRSGAAAR